ncbi:glycosyltransferase family 2 protein [Palleniella muris]|nr:glycosyltransferase [Palleniella muris]
MMGKVGINVQPLVSVIVPVYNAERYLLKCIDSLLTQTYSNIELLLVNDGSKDGSGNICDDYARKDSRIRVIHLENGGVSRARNKALEIMKGDWVCFADSDDEVTPTYVQHFVDAIEDNVDIIIAGAKFVHEDGRQTVLGYKKYGILSLPEIFSDNEITAHGYAWSKCYRASHIRSNTYNKMLRFPEEIKFSEDLIFVMQYLAISPKAKYISSSDYIYYLRSTSASGRVFPFKVENCCLNRYIELIHELSRQAGMELMELQAVGSILSMLFARVRNSMYRIGELSKTERIAFYQSQSLSVYQYILQNNHFSNILVRIGYILFMHGAHWRWLDAYFYVMIGIVGKMVRR